ncbi:MAG: nuclear transport factor 2 family protein [Dehalococcoidales bacterium]|nr:nuclear transport factor 2 family protein [Dehalococcoidales bacterium]
MDQTIDIENIKNHLEILNMQGRYNHYMLCGRFDKITEMFAKKYPVEAEFADSGLFYGLEGIRKLFAIVGEKYGFSGELGLHMLMTPVVEVALDGKTAKGMWHTLGCNTYKEGNKVFAMWQTGKYDITFVKENEEWKYGLFKWYVIFRTPYDKGWVEKPIIESLRQDDSPQIGSLYSPYDPNKIGVFLPLPPEPQNIK